MKVMTLDSLELEITSVCTLACPGCSRVNTAHKKDLWDKGHIDFDTISSIIKNSEFKSYHLIGCYGDAIYHPKFWEVVQVLQQEDKHWMVHTNGSSRSRKWWEQSYDIEFKDEHRNNFCFAIDGLEDTNNVYRINSKWKTIITGLEVMSKHPTPPKLTWRWLDFPYTRHQQEEAKMIAEDYGMHFEVHPSFRSSGQYVHETPEIFVD